MRTLCLTIALLLVAPAASAQTRDRAAIPEQHKWNLADLYPSDDAWKQAKEKLASELPRLGQFRGKLASSPQTLLQALETRMALRKELARLWAYANMSADQDTRVGKYQAMKQEIAQVAADYDAAGSYIAPEILAMKKGALDKLVAREPKLKVYRHHLDDILRKKAHTLSPAEERLVAMAGPLADSPETLYGIFADGDFPFPKVKLANGQEVTIDKSSFGVHRASTHRADRQKVFSAFFGALGRYRATFGAALNAQLNRDAYYMRARNYPTTLEASLDESAVPVEVYKAHLANLNKSLPTFHRYLKLRQRMMGVDKLQYSDLWAPLVGSVDLKYPVDDARKVIAASLAPLGEDYVRVVQRSFDERWIDLYPNEGKRSGAYSEGAAYDVHPYMLLNYNDKYDDLTTLTHELGHTMQSYYSNKAQAYVNADYPIFVAEVASTFNEALLIDHVLKTIQDDDTRLALLGNYLDNLRLTVFRQTQFAEFELRAHEQVEKGQPMTGDSFGALYLEIVRKYYGHDQGVTVVPDEVQHEWAMIPHFYYNYYVFQYATSFTASAALSEKVLAGDKAATRRYLDFLAAGGSEYPIELLKKAGVDMTTSEPLDLTMRKMNRVIDEIEQILARKKK